MARGERVLQLARRRPGPAGIVLLPFTWLALGLLVLSYVVGILLFGFAAILWLTLRFLLSPPLRVLARLPGIREVVQRRRMRRYARVGVAELEQRLQSAPRPRRTPE